MRRTKIVCTIGPASNSQEVLTKMIAAGMNVARLNFSHGTHEYHGEAIKLIKLSREKAGVPLAILLDTKGPEIRLGTFENKTAEIFDGDEFVLTSREVVGSNKCVPVSIKALPSQLKAGNRVLINDGAIELHVRECTDTDIICTVIHGGILSDRKGVNIPSVHIDMPYLSEQDKSDLLFGIESGVDFVAASFVRSKEDMIALRNFVNFNGGHDIRLIA
ncbi:MAG: pyruvate kinase, partial [Clostridiales bacterium]|nr:pyruvate kinase [Clostridiales bacterium]